MRTAIPATMLLAAIASAQTSAQSLDPKAEEVIARSRASESTYTIYWRANATGPSLEPSYAWGATFRRGSLLRVEDTRSRAVADCSSGTATKYDLSVGRDDYSFGKKIAKQYCGIDADRKALSTRWLGQKDGKFGLVDEVEVVDRHGTYHYQVTKAGEVVGLRSTFRGTDVKVVLEPMSFELVVPSGDLFSKKSLGASRVPKTIQSRGARPDR